MLALVRKPAVETTLERKQVTAPRRLQLKPLSDEELFEVNRATFREGRNHCRWPKEVIEKFLAQPV